VRIAKHRLRPGRLAPDFKTITDSRRDNGAGIRNVCRRFIVLLNNVAQKP